MADQDVGEQLKTAIFQLKPSDEVYMRTENGDIELRSAYSQTVRDLQTFLVDAGVQQATIHQAHNNEDNATDSAKSDVTGDYHPYIEMMANLEQFFTKMTTLNGGIQFVQMDNDFMQAEGQKMINSSVEVMSTQLEATLELLGSYQAIEDETMRARAEQLEANILELMEMMHETGPVMTHFVDKEGQTHTTKPSGDSARVAVLDENGDPMHNPDAALVPLLAVFAEQNNIEIPEQSPLHPDYDFRTNTAVMAEDESTAPTLGGDEHSQRVYAFWNDPDRQVQHHQAANTGIDADDFLATVRNATAMGVQQPYPFDHPVPDSGKPIEQDRADDAVIAGGEKLREQIHEALSERAG